MEYSSTPILEEGRIIGAVVTFKDISEREFLEMQDLLDTVARLLSDPESCISTGREKVTNPRKF